MREPYELFPESVRSLLPPIGSGEAAGENAPAHVKFFCPWSNWTWYASEYDPVEREFFGVVVGFEREYGSFSLDELMSVRGPGGLRIERDIYWTPKPLKDCL